jgi:NitT/TauT family transport system substrate-binding protein
MHMKSHLFRAMAVAGMAVAGLALAAPALAQSGDLPVLKLALADGTINPTPASVLRLAGTLGFYEKHGVKVEIVELNGTPQAVAALNSGDVDLADIAIDSVVRLRADDALPIRGVFSSSVGSPFLVAAKEAITSPADLAGKAYAIANSGSLDQTLTESWLTNIGMSPDTPTWVPIGPPATRVQALAAGRVDATTVSFGTYMSIASEPGIHILVMPAEFGKSGPQLSKFISGLESTIAAKHDAIQHFSDALIDAARTLQAHPEQWVAAMRVARDDLSEETLTKTAEFFTPAWCVNGCMNKDMIAQTIGYIYGTEDFADVKQLDPAELVDLSFVTQSVQSMGPIEGGMDTP